MLTDRRRYVWVLILLCSLLATYPGADALPAARANNGNVLVNGDFEDGNGFILRCRETAGKTGETELKLPTLRLRGAWLCNGVEVNQRKLPSTAQTVAVPFKPNQYITVRLDAESGLVKTARP